MQKRIFTLILVVIIGILTGVAVVKKQARDPLLREILNRQQKILQGQARVERKIENQGDVGEMGDSSMAQRLQKLENRIVVLETQIKALQGAGGGGIMDAARQAPLLRPGIGCLG